MTAPFQIPEITILDEPGRYRILEVIGCGGMGYVYKALDTKLRKHIAIKTLRDRPTEAYLDRFRREIEVLAALEDDNIVSILNIGECEHDRIRKPYLMMPFLEGMTLDHLAKTERLPVERCVKTVFQVCQGLRAAHRQDIIHRDIKPSNIFVRSNGSVKIIDFGLARMLNLESTVGRVGTFRYMSPEQIEGKEVDKRSDLFSLGVVFYELLANKHPFFSDSENEDRTKIDFRKPALVKTFNPEVDDSLCCVVHKALQRDPRFRFQTAEELSADLEKILNKKPLDYCDLGRMEPWLTEATTALQRSRLEEASDHLDALESRGYWHPRIDELREEIGHAKTASEIRRLLSQANEQIESRKYELALNSLNRVLVIDAENADAQKRIAEVGRLLEEGHIESLLESARAHLQNQDFEGAEGLIQNIFECRPDSPQAIKLSRQIAQKKTEFEVRKRQTQTVYDKALKAFQSGNISTALHNVEELLKLVHSEKHPDPRYAEIYSKVKSTHDFLLREYEDAEKLVEAKKFTGAVTVCERVLSKYPNDVRFRVLLTTIKHREIELRSAEIAALVGRVNNEPDLEKKTEIFEEGLRVYPDEPRLLEALRSTRDLRQIVKSIVDNARELEQQQDFDGATNQYETLKKIYPQYPGLGFQLERLQKRLQEQLRQNAKVAVIEEIRYRLAESGPEAALEFIESAKEFHGDPELEQLRREAQHQRELRNQTRDLCEQAASYIEKENYQDAVPLLEKARQLDPEHPRAAELLVASLYALATLHSQDWRTAEELLHKISAIDRNNEKVTALSEVVQDRKRNEFTTQTLVQADELRMQGLLAQSLAVLEEGLGIYPNNPRLSRRRDEVKKLREAQEALERRAADDSRKDGALARILGEIELLESEKAVPKLKQALSLTLQALADHPETPELLACKDRLERRIRDALSMIEGSTEPIRSDRQTEPLESTLSVIDRPRESSPDNQDLRPLDEVVRPQLKRPRFFKSRRLAGATLLLVLLGSLAYGTYAWKQRSTSIRSIQVSIVSEPSGAHVTIGNKEGTTPFVTTVEVPRSAPSLAYEVRLPNYVAYSDSLLLEPDKTSYTIPPVALKVVGTPPDEALYDSARESAARIKMMSHQEAGFLDEVDRFASIVNQLQTMDSANNGIREKGVALRNDVKANLTSKFESLPPNQKDSEKGLPLLNALSRVDPEDSQTKKWMAAYPELIRTLKTQIDAAIQKRLFLTSETGGALSLLDSLRTSFPSEAAFSRRKREEIQASMFRLLEEKCQIRTPECERYGQLAQGDFVTETARIRRTVDNAPRPSAPATAPAPPASSTVRPQPSAPATAPQPPASSTVPPQPVPVTATPPTPVRTPTALEAQIKEMSSRMEEAFIAKRYVLPKDNSSLYFSSEISRLARANSTDVGPDAKSLVDRAEVVTNQSRLLAEQDVALIRANESTKQFAQALLDKSRASQVLTNFERARDTWTEASAVLATPPTQKLKEIGSRISALQQLLKMSFYPVKDGSCNGTLQIDGFSVTYTKSNGNCMSFERQLDKLTASQDKATVELKSTQSPEKWKFEDSTENGSRQVKEATAIEIVERIRSLTKLRDDWNR